MENHAFDPEGRSSGRRVGPEAAASGPGKGAGTLPEGCSDFNALVSCRWKTCRLPKAVAVRRGVFTTRDGRARLL